MQYVGSVTLRILWMLKCAPYFKVSRTHDKEWKDQAHYCEQEPAQQPHEDKS